MTLKQILPIVWAIVFTMMFIFMMLLLYDSYQEFAVENTGNNEKQMVESPVDTTENIDLYSDFVSPHGIYALRATWKDVESVLQADECDLSLQKVQYAQNGTPTGEVSEPLQFPLTEMICYKPSYWRGVGLYDFITWINDETFLTRKANSLFLYNVSGAMSTYPIDIEGLAFKGVDSRGKNWVFEKESQKSQIEELQVLNEKAEVEWEFAFESFNNVLLSSEVHVDNVNDGALIELLFKRNVENSTKQKVTIEFYWLSFADYSLNKLYSSAEYDASVTSSTDPDGVIESIPGTVVLSGWSNEFPFRPASSTVSGNKDMMRFVLEK